jgi:chemotaxis signal transduction protein
MEDEGVTILFLQVEDRSFGVEVHQVETLRRKETIYPSTEGPPDLLGFLTLGGGVVPILDLGIRLGVHQVAGKKSGMLVVPPAELTPLAFRVDRVAGPVRLGWNELALLPRLLCELQPRPMTWAVAWQGEDVVPVLDLGQLVPPEDVAVLLDLAAGVGSR